MAVNEEAEALAEAIPGAARLLERGGRLGVISFHSGEDRIVKRHFRSFEDGGDFAGLLPAPLLPGPDEVKENPRARSARLRVLERRESP